MGMLVYQCEDSLEGIFTAVYTAYEEKREPSDTMLSLEEELYLFAEYQTVKPEPEKAVKVMRTLKRKFGEEDYMQLCLALSAPNSQKAQAVYQTIALGLAGKKAAWGHLLDNLANDYVNQTFSLARGAMNENCHLKGFVRFQELEGGILYSKIGPKNNLLTFLMPHFADRFPMENFILLDEKRNLFGVHPAGGQWYLLSGSRILEGAVHFKLSEEERKYQELFCHFCHKIAIKERENLKLQRNMLPLRFQEYMIEFN